MSSRAANKNQKRREKKRDEKITSLVEERKREEAKAQNVDPTVVLKAQLAEAKTSGVSQKVCLFFTCESLLKISTNIRKHELQCGAVDRNSLMFFHSFHRIIN